jgi:quinol monooxygenase YgiN
MGDKERTAEVVTAARISIDPEKRKELFLTISSLLSRVRREKGCRAYRFYRDASGTDTFLLIGEWATLSDWLRHMNSDNFTVLLGCLEILGNDCLDFKVLSQVHEVEALIGNESKNIREQSAAYDSHSTAVCSQA